MIDINRLPHGTETVEKVYDLVVIGGGLAGISAAVMAARLGCSVVLIHNRPILGGNFSSEIGVHLSGAAAIGRGVIRHMRETGIVEEIATEIRHSHHHHRNVYMQPIQDLVLLDYVSSEPKIDLFLNTEATYAIMETSTRIQGIVAYQQGSECIFYFRGSFFADCSGDGRIAADAGAKFWYGCEARKEYAESLAPEVANNQVMGGTLRLRTKKMDHPVPFTPPSWAYDYPSDESLPFREHDRVDEAYYWWIEWGGELNTIADNQLIGRELLRHVFGVWDHIKNHGAHGAENYVLDWVGTVVGKRESRRFIGDHILTQRDIKEQTLFVDRVTYGGWPIDLHPVEGIRSSLPPCEQRFVPVYSIPFRCLYSQNIANLFFAGRNISASHVAFASTRVMGTCAILGQAVGAGAYLCNKYRIDPREVAKLYIKELQQLLLKNDCYIIEVRNEDSKDLARRASVTGSSVQPLEVINDEGLESLEVPCAQSFIVTGKRIDCISLLLESKTQSPTEIKARLWMANNLYEFVAHTKAGEAIAVVKPGEKRWVEFSFNVDISPGIYWIELSCAPDLYWCYSNESPIGAVRADLWDNLNPDKIKKTSNHQPSSEKNSHQGMPIPLNERMDLSRDGWRVRRGGFCFRISPSSYLYLPTNVVSGISRPTPTEVNIWISNGKIGLPQWLELDFGSPKSFNTIYLTFDTHLDHQVFERQVPEPECVRDYILFYLRKDQWVPFLQEHGNYHRRRIHSFSTVTSRKIRLEILATNGTPQARIYEIRVYYEKRGQKSKK